MIIEYVEELTKEKISQVNFSLYMPSDSSCSRFIQIRNRFSLNYY